jgi:hypothetical protein
VFRPYRLTLSLVIGCLLLTPSAALAGARPQVTIVGSCAGDTVSGNVVVRSSGATPFTVRLLHRSKARARWVRTGRARTFTAAAGRHRYRFSFDVSSLDAFAYRLSAEGRHGGSPYRSLSRVIPATSCAPGRDVPEAPFALLLPLSLLATASLLLIRQRAFR